MHGPGAVTISALGLILLVGVSNPDARTSTQTRTATLARFATPLSNDQADIAAGDAAVWTSKGRAVQAGDEVLALGLSMSGAGVGAEVLNRNSPLEIAAELAHAERIEGNEPGAETPDQGRRTPLHNAAEGGRIAEVKTLLELGADVNAREQSGATALHLAALFGHQSVAELLLSFGADVNARMADGFTPLFLASAMGHVETVKLLLESKADVKSSVNGITPLHLAAQTGNQRLAEILLSGGADATARDNEGLTPIHASADHGYPAVLEFFLAQGPELAALIHVGVKDGRTPLHFATLAAFTKPSLDWLPRRANLPEPDYRGVVELLLTHKVDVNRQANNGWTALHYAAATGNRAVLELLLAHKSDLGTKGIDGFTAFHAAVDFGQAEIAAVLLRQGAFVKRLVNAEVNDGKTPLHLAALAERGSLTGFLVRPDYIATVKLLVANNANIRAKDKSGATPLHLAAGKGNDQVVESLLLDKANIDSADLNGATPLHWAVLEGQTTVVKILLDRGAKPNAKTKNGQSALGLAKIKNHREIIKLLIGRGAKE